MAIQAVDWFVPEHHVGLRCRFCEVLSAKEEKGKTFEKIRIHSISKKHN